MAQLGLPHRGLDFSLLSRKYYLELIGQNLLRS